MTNPLRVWIAFALLSLAWGSSYLFIRLGLRQLTPLSLVGLRLLVGALVIGIIAYLRRQDLRLDSRQRWWIILVATVNTAVPFLLISWGEVTVPSGLASVLNSTVPIFSVLLAGAVLHDEPVTSWRVGGVAIGFAGVVLLLSRDLTQGGVLWSHLAGQGAIVLASVCYAAAAVMTRRTLRGVPPLTIAVYVLAVSTTEVLGLSLVFSRPPLLAMHGLTVFSILWLGVLGTGFAYVLAFFILSEWGAARYTLVAYMLPVVGLTLGAIVLSEHIDWRILGGSALVVLGIVLASIVRRPGESAGSAPPAEPSLAGDQRGVETSRPCPSGGVD